jgi:hypothetical protein
MLLLEAAAFLGLARLAVVALPFRWLIHGSGQSEANRDDRTGRWSAESIARVRWAVGTLARYTPWDSNCLAQALAARRMLERRRIASTLHLGVRKDDRGQLQAHAWLRWRDQLITGGHGHKDYAEVASFAGRMRLR